MKRAHSKESAKGNVNNNKHAYLIAGNKVMRIKCNIIIVLTNNYNLIRLNVALNKT